MHYGYKTGYTIMVNAGRYERITLLLGLTKLCSFTMTYIEEHFIDLLKPKLLNCIKYKLIAMYNSFFAQTAR